MSSLGSILQNFVSHTRISGLPYHSHATPEAVAGLLLFLQNPGKRAVLAVLRIKVALLLVYVAMEIGKIV